MQTTITGHIAPSIYDRDGVLFHLGDFVEYDRHDGRHSEGFVIDGMDTGAHGYEYTIADAYLDDRQRGIRSEVIKLEERESGSVPAIPNHGGWNPATGHYDERPARRF